MDQPSIPTDGTAALTRVSCDVGGTFTDLCFLNEATGELHVAKTPTTPDPIDGVLKGIADGGVELNRMSLFSHGTTLATNALITRNFPQAVMVTTRGFRDVIEIKRGTRDDCWDTYKEMSGPYIRRRDRLEITERVDYSGKVLVDIDEAEVRELARIIRKRAVKTIAICFANAFANPDNEIAVRDILRAELPDCAISLSSEIMPEIFEHERFSTTVANAVLAPVVGTYTRALADRMEAGGYGEDVLLLHSGGGVMTARNAADFAARLAASGIAAGAIASRFIAQQAGFENSISLDMGGTSTDISVCNEGNLSITTDWHVEYGNPIKFPSIEVLTIGAGGGSLAWIDAAGSLRNGPQSAGSTPGPACYGKGGTRPTNSDANVILGRLGSTLAGGEVELEPTRAEAALKTEISGPLGMSVEDAAVATIKVANANMADAVRLVSIRKGHDPRDFVLVAFGGAGALHGAGLARDLGIPTVLIPPNPGVTSALGCLLVDITHDISQMYLRSTDDADVADIEAGFAELERQGHERLSQEGVADEDMLFQRFIDMRYLGQWRARAISVGAPVSSLDQTIDQFHIDHGREHNYSRPDAPTEIYRLSVKATGLTKKAKLAQFEPATQPAEPFATRHVRFDELPEKIETPLFDRALLRPGHVIAGPSVIEQLDSTILVPPGFSAVVGPDLTLRMDVPELD